MEPELAEVRDFFAAHAPFSQLPQALLDTLPTRCSLRYHRRGSTLLDPEDTVTDLLVVRSGALDVHDRAGALVERVDVGGSVGVTGLLEDPNRHGAHVGQRGVVPLLIQPGAGLGPTVLGAVAQGEEGFQAAQLGTVPGDLQDLIRREIRRVASALKVTWCGDESAVMAAVAAEFGDRDEDLGGVGHRGHTPGGLQASVAHAGRGYADPIEFSTGRRQQRRHLAEVEADASFGARDRAAYLLGCGVVAHDPLRLSPGPYGEAPGLRMVTGHLGQDLN